MNSIRLAILALTAACASHCFASAEPADTAGFAGRWRPQLSLGITGGGVLHTSPMVRGENATMKPLNSVAGGDLQASFRMPRGSQADRLYPYVYQGIGIAADAFGPSTVAGTPMSLYVLQGSRIATLSDRLSLDYEWNFGASGGWHHVSEPDPTETDKIDGFGSRFNAYIGLRMLLRYRIGNRLSAFVSAGIAHYSNGNTSYPNPGLNTVAARAGLVWYPGADAAEKRICDWSGFTRHWTVDVTAWGAWRKALFCLDEAYNPSGSIRIVPGHFGMAGIAVNPIFRFNPVVGAGPSLDVEYDEGSDLSRYFYEYSYPDDPRFLRPPLHTRFNAGVSARIELTMPVFSINIGLGCRVYAPAGHDRRGLYQTFTLKTSVTRNLYISTGYELLRFRDPGNLMLGAGWSFCQPDTRRLSRDAML